MHAHSLFGIMVLFLTYVPASVFAQSDRVKTVSIVSQAVGRTLKYNIVLPDKYDQTNQRYPVLYLLHGLTSDYTAWARLGVPEVSQGYDLIVVMPDVGNSWYVNWSKSEGDQKNHWEDFIIKDLIGHIDSTYRTIASREGRAINGLSMGGYGGIMLGLRHPDLFCSIGGESGALSVAKSLAQRLRSGQPLPLPRREPSTIDDPRIGIKNFSSQKDRTPQGTMFTTAEEAESYDPFQLVLKVPREKLPHIYLDCGTEDRLIAGNLEFAKLLMDKKIPFTFSQSMGAHTPPYWRREIAHAMAVQFVLLQRELKSTRKSEVQRAPGRP